MSIVFTFFHHPGDVVVQRRRFKLAVGFFTQMEDGQARGEILVIRRFAGDQVRRCLNDGFVDIGSFDAVVKLNVRAQFYLRNRNVIQSFCRPIQYTVDFIEINALGATVTLCHQQTLIHVDYTCP